MNYMKKVLGKIAFFGVIAGIAAIISLFTNLSQPVVFTIILGGVWLAIVPILLLFPLKRKTNVKEKFMALFVVIATCVGLLLLAWLLGMVSKTDTFLVFEFLVLGECLVARVDPKPKKYTEEEKSRMLDELIKLQKEKKENN